jgi:hypothetical protein
VLGVTLSVGVRVGVDVVVTDIVGVGVGVAVISCGDPVNSNVNHIENF